MSIQSAVVPSPNDAVAQYLFRQPNPSRMAAIRKYAGKSILDCGCGNGAYIKEFVKDYDIHGMDMAEFPTWACFPGRFRQGSVVDLPYEDESFDTVTSFEVLEHVPNTVEILKGFHRVARKNIIISVPNCDIPQGMQDSRLTFFHYTDDTHCNFFTLDTISKACADAGFQVRDAKLINEVNLLPLFKEAFYGPQFVWKIMNRYLRRRPLHMTCLVVADKV